MVSEVRSRGSGDSATMVDERPAVCMFVYNNCLSDQRVMKEARTVARAGHRVTIIAVLDKKSTPIEEHPDFTIIRINRDPLHYKLLRRTRQMRRRLRVRRARARLALRRATARIRRFWRVRRVGLRRLTARLRRGAAARRRVPSGNADPLQDTSRGVGPLAVLGVPLIAYRALRWRVLRRVPALRRRFYARQTTGGALAVRRARARVRRRLKVDPEGIRAELRRPLLPEMRGLVPKLSPGRAFGAVDRAVSAAAYRSLMAFHRPLMFTDYYRRAFRLVVDEGYVVFQAHDVITLPVAAWQPARRAPSSCTTPTNSTERSAPSRNESGRCGTPSSGG